ncbi:MAG: 23S rRNA (pseudouridine(1915)-N(3))-methyltransferase RlmH [Desulfitobacterium hafniense]|nr:23S rRNA (pseudouridine(1915)-N(3))-methyltransferase RlmH [Desulfitobacterium hafniense]
MQIKIIAIGKLKEKYLQEGIKEYTKRLSAYAKLDIMELPDEPCPEKLSPADEDRVKEREGNRILKAVSSNDYVILLDVQGKTLDSPGFSKLFEDLALSGRSNLIFIVGGSLGVSQSVKNRADISLSFSKLTFPHQLMRLILLEQIYRANRISRGEPYHK